VPWVIATLRGQKVYARADAAGSLLVEGGRVEVRYKPNDGRRYDARADNLVIQPGEVLPEETCGAAEKPAEKEKAGASKSASGGSSASAPTAPTAPPEGAIIAYADGACSGNPGPSGLGVVVIDEQKRIEVSEFLGTGTNNIAELTAILRAIEAAAPGKPLVIHTDSQYSIGVLQKGWKAKANQELVAQVKTAFKARAGTRLQYVPGHAGVALNERADALARMAVSTRGSTRTETARKQAES
jgi:ribonuclease HI